MGEPVAQAQAPVNVCCLKWGDLYGPEYVNILYNMVDRHLDRPFRFICFTEKDEGLSEQVEVWPLPEFEEPPWEYARYCSAWRKLALFQPGLADMTGRVLFLDLDVVLMDSISCFFEHDLSSGQVGMIENWYQMGQNVGQASVMTFEAGAPVDILNHYLTDPLRTLNRYRTEQAYISGYLSEQNSKACFFPESWCRSYKKHSMPQGIKKWFTQQNAIPDQVKILVFHGRPNPPDAIKGSWGKSFAWYKRWYKRLYPSPWLAHYWK